ncbi:MAG: DUF167 domain-containing protein [Tatlockia sp.]|jgi:hypothetical protein
MAPWYHYTNGNLILTLHIQPGAKSTLVVGLHGDALKIKLASPPIDGRANDALLRFIANRFDLPLQHIRLIRGEKSRRKVVEVRNCNQNPESILLPSR